MPYQEADWSHLGFQQSGDPASDFRAMGVLGLSTMVYFAEHQQDVAREILVDGHALDDPLRMLPMALAAINVASSCSTLWKRAASTRSLWWATRAPSRSTCAP